MVDFFDNFEQKTWNGDVSDLFDDFVQQQYKSP